jgi:hypothetical protein
VSSPLDAAVLALSPDFYCPFDESSGTTALDLTGNGRTFTYTTSDFTLGQTGLIPSDTETAVLGTVTTNWASSSYRPSIASGPALTFMAAFRFGTLPGALSQVQNSLSGTTSGMSLRLNASNQPAFVLANGTTDATVTLSTGIFASGITAGDNYLAFGTYSGTTMTLIVYDLTSGASASNTGTLATGSYQPSNSITCSQKGVYGRSALWSTTALSATQITALYNAATYPGTATGSLSLTGSAAAAVGIAATAASTATLTGAATGAVGVAGTAATSTTLSSSATGAVGLAGTAATSSTLSGAAAGAVGIPATAASTLTLTGTAAAHLAATAASTATLAGAAAGAVGVVAAATATAALTSSATGAVGVPATAMSSASLTGVAVGKVTLVLHPGFVSPSEPSGAVAPSEALGYVSPSELVGSVSPSMTAGFVNPSQQSGEA